MSIARAHFQRTMATREQRAAGGEAATGPVTNGVASLLRVHQGRLKAIQSRAAKIEAKRGMLPDFDAYIDGVLAANGGAQDDVVTTVMLWRLDVGDWFGALDIAGYGIRHGLEMPERFARDLPTTVVEEIADSALVLCAAQDAAADALAEPLQEALDLTSESDMPDEVRAKAHKALGLILKDSDAAQAVQHLETALTLDPKSGVKTELTRLKKALDAPAGS
ncbi:MAG: terminase [Rhodospirillaceae bacterium]|nr:terminase [Rhodospirillales bacterium]